MTGRRSGASASRKIYGGSSCSGVGAAGSRRRERKKSETIGVSSAIVAMPNKRNVTSTPSDYEFGL